MKNNGITVNKPHYDDISRVPKLTAKRFHSALERFIGVTIYQTCQYDSIRRQRGNTAECRYNFDECRWEVIEMYNTQSEKSKINQPTQEQQLTNEQLWESMKAERAAQNL